MDRNRQKENKLSSLIQETETKVNCFCCGTLTGLKDLSKGELGYLYCTDCIKTKYRKVKKAATRMDVENMPDTFF